MKLHYSPQTIVIPCLLFLSLHVTSQQNSKPPQPAIYQQKMQSSALLFMENKGQIANNKGKPQPDILFTANSGGAKIYLTANGIHYQFSRTEYPKGYDPFSKEPAKDPQQEDALRKQIKTSTHRFTVELQGANQHPTVSKQGKSSYYENYYLAQCPDGITGVHGYEKIIYKNVYPNIDWVVYSKGGFMEYDFLVHPGGNPASIKLKIKDADKVSITPQGELLMKTSLGEVREKAPVSYANGQLTASRFKQNSDGTIGFAVQVQPGKELRIDPSIVWSTYYGATGYERPSNGTRDGNSDVYISGLTWSNTGITSGGFQNVYGGGGSDAFLVKFNSLGSRIWATYYGGNNDDTPGALSTDNNNNIYLGGNTLSTSSIASNGFQNSYGGGSYDAFLVKFTTAGNRVWSTYYGGSGRDEAYSCTVDINGNVYLSGNTTSPNAIASNGLQSVFGGGYSDAYLVKFNSFGSRLWGTYFGGTEIDYGLACCADNTGAIYLTGQSTSNNLSSGGFQNTYGGQGDAFLIKFTTTGTRLWCTYYGGSSQESGNACTVDYADNVYLSGNTFSLTNVASGGYQNTNGGQSDAFLVKLNSAGNRIWATYYGGNDSEGVGDCKVDATGSVYICGSTRSSNGIAFNGFQSTYITASDGFIAKFNSNGNRIWGSYFGGSGDDFMKSCMPDNIGNVYVSGGSWSAGLGMNGYQNTYAGGSDAFFVKIGDEPLCIVATQPIISPTADTICTGNSTTLSIASGSLNSATTWQWRKDSCNGAMVGTGTNITVSPIATTTYFVRGEGGCAALGNCTSKTIVVNPVVTASVTLTANPAGPIPAGTSVTFTAIATNGGTAPLYTFRVNNTPVQSGTSNTYTTNTLANGDSVMVIMRSNMPCVTNPVIDSPPITIIVATPCILPTTPTISTNYDTVCTGATPTLTIATGNLNSATHWQWYTNSCGGTPVGNTSSITFTPAVTTTYYVRGEGGCVTPGNCASKTIYVKTKPIVTFIALPATICAGDTSTVSFTGTAPANAAYTWNWGNGNVISGSGAGPYKVVYNTASSIGLTVNNGTCSVAATTQTINPMPAPELTFNVSDTIGCEPLAVTLTAYSLNVTSWTWDFGDGVTLNNVNTPVQHTYATGNYTASLTVRRGNCATTAMKTIKVYRKPTAAFSALPGINTPVVISGASFNFINISQDASRYLWQFGDVNTSNLATPSHRYNAAGIYAVKLYAYNPANCIDSFELKPFIVIADTAPAFSIPNAFSPNKDGINDIWMIQGLQGNVACKVNIYNRWGQTIFTSTDYGKPWDGTYNSKPLPVDTYYYVITVGNKSYTGSVMLLR